MTITKEMIPTIRSAQIIKAYRGLFGQCRCGCAGKYYHTEAMRERAGKERGYPVTDDEISPTKVAEILRAIIQFAEDAEIQDNIVDVQVGARVYTVYLAEPTAGKPETR